MLDPPELRKRLRRWRAFSLLGILASATATYFAMTYLRPSAGNAASPGKTSSTPAGAWSDAALQQLDQALAADQAGDARGALRIASALLTPGAPPPPGLDLYLASLHSRLERNYDAEADLLRLNVSAPPAEAALINERLAFNFSRTRDFEKASEHYKDASRQDPFSATLYYRWGEAARHLGHFSDARAIFRRALDRVPTGQPEHESLRECIGLKARLCAVEEGQDEKFQAELAERLKEPVPSGYWLLTAAASALQHKNLPEAAGFLGRARDALGKEQFDELLNDYFFRAYADRKELADFFPSDPAARRAKLLPTMTYSIEP